MRSFLKTLIIIVVFAAAMVTLMIIKGNAVSGNRIHHMVFIERNEDWNKCKLDNVLLLDSLNSVSFYPGAGKSELTTESIDAGFPFTRLILSWNCTKPDTVSAINFIVKVSADNKDWTRFEYLMFGALDSERTAALKIPPIDVKDIGKVDIDNLNLKKAMRYARVIVQVDGPYNSSQIVLRRLSLSFSADNATMADFKKLQSNQQTKTIGRTKLAVPYFTQRNLPSNLSGNCCSPTSICMVLNYYGKTVDPELVAHRVFDPAHQIYGNWPFNVEAAYLSGLSKCWVESHNSFDELYDEIISGKPVVISIAYGLNELPNSPIHEAPEGHLIVIVGFDGPNTVICNDPAGHNVDDGIVRYPRKELESIWLSHGGVAYHLWAE